MQYILLGALLASTLQSAPFDNPSSPPPAETGRKTRPVLSPLGLKKVKESLHQLTENERILSSNVTIIDENLKTLSGDLESVAKLLKEQEDLKAKYLAYLTAADKEIIKNQKSQKELEGKEKKLISGPTSAAAARVQLEGVQTERVDRQRWLSDAQSKTRRVHDLMNDLMQKERRLLAERQGIEREIANLKKKRDQFEEQRENIAAQRAPFEKRIEK